MGQATAKLPFSLDSILWSTSLLQVEWVLDGQVEVPMHQWQAAVLATMHKYNSTHTDTWAYSYTCTFMNSLLPHLNLVHVPTYTCPWLTHSCTYIHTYAGPKSIHMHWCAYIYTLLHMCEYPLSSRKVYAHMDRLYTHILYYAILMHTNSS